MALSIWIWPSILTSLVIMMAIRGWRYLMLLRGTGGRCLCSPPLHGKTVIITGATAGIGKEAAINFASRGVRLILACRNISKAHSVAKEIIERTGHQEVIVKHLDVSDLVSVRKFAIEILAEEPKLHILINNAGIPESSFKLSPQGFDILMATNHYGPFLLTNLLIGLLKKSSPSRIVNVTSKVHLNCRSLPLEDLNRFVEGGSIWEPYVRSKLCNILFTRELAEKLKGTGVTTNCVHPGSVNTNIFWKVKHWSFRLFLAPLVSFIGKTAEEGCHPVVHVAVSEDLAATSGKYYDNFKESMGSKLTRDQDLARKLWEVTRESVGPLGEDVLLHRKRVSFIN